MPYSMTRVDHVIFLVFCLNYDVILTAILNNRHIGLINNIYFVIFEFCDPENPLVDILQAY